MASKRLESGKPKKPYVKPEFIQVALRPEEAVLGSCKSSVYNGPNTGGKCWNGVALCSVQGS